MADGSAPQIILPSAPAHFMGLWPQKLSRGYALGSEEDASAHQRRPDVVDAPRSNTAWQADLFGGLAA